MAGNLYVPGRNKSSWSERFIPDSASLADRVDALEKVVAFLMRDDLETHRRLDSLIGEMKEGHIFSHGIYLSDALLKQDSTLHINMLYYWLPITGPVGNVNLEKRY